MLPFEQPTIFEQLPKYFFSVPKVVSDQKGKFESDELFRRLSRESEIRYAGYKDRPAAERRIRFATGCREGQADIVFIPTGTNLQLVFNSCVNGFSDYCDFEKERGKVHFKSSFIMNGVCVYCKGWLDLEKLEGIGSLEYDQERGAIEDSLLREHIERWKQHLKKTHPIDTKPIHTNKMIHDKPSRNDSSYTITLRPTTEQRSPEKLVLG